MRSAFFVEFPLFFFDALYVLLVGVDALSLHDLYQNFLIDVVGIFGDHHEIPAGAVVLEPGPAAPVHVLAFSSGEQVAF